MLNDDKRPLHLLIIDHLKNIDDGAGKLLSRSQKVAYTLLNKSFSKTGETCLKCGDRLALVYPNNDPINFMCAFYGCMLAGIVPVPIEVPLTRRVSISLCYVLVWLLLISFICKRRVHF